MPGSAVLFANDDKTVILIDGPRSIEEAQAHARDLGSVPLRRLISTKPPDTPFATPEPKDHGGTLLQPASAQLAELMTGAAVSDALKLLKDQYAGPWCLSRMLPASTTSSTGGKRKLPIAADEAVHDPTVFIPEGSVYLSGTIESERATFVSKAPLFDLILLDPPWPNRSARRKKDGYSTAESLSALRQTLSLIPVQAHLAPGGLIAIWITNRASVSELLTSSRGILAEWGLETVDEWTWLKVTTAGEPLYRVDSRWRKPWERLLIARRAGSQRKWSGQRKVIVSVPDVHSRKPNLRPLFDELMPPSYTALEVFARSLTAGWWSWGDEVLEFQRERHWVSDSVRETEDAIADQNV